MNTVLCRLFGWSGGQVASQTEIFIRTMVVVAALAGVVHVAFLALFAFLGLTELVALNVLSIGVYALAYRTVRQWPLTTVGLMALEISLHGWVAVRYLGWESGFHYYLMLVLPVAIVSSGLHGFDAKWVRWGWGGGSALLYLAMDAFMSDAAPVHQLPESVMRVLHTVNLASMFALLALLTAVYRELLLQAESVLRYQACTDPLTQLQNRRAVLDVIHHEAAALGRMRRPLTVILADVDHFKAINDKHGHEAGDSVLQAVASVCGVTVRQMDHVARWGGEEFLIVLPATDLPEALLVAERLRAHMAAQVCPSAKGPIPVTMTLGVAQMRLGESVEQLIARADKALYEGKQAGRNRVVAEAEAVNLP